MIREDDQIHHITKLIILYYSRFYLLERFISLEASRASNVLAGNGSTLTPKPSKALCEDRLAYVHYQCLKDLLPINELKVCEETSALIALLSAKVGSM